MGYAPSKPCGFGLRLEKDRSGSEKSEFNHSTWTNEKTGANKEGKDEGETNVVTVIPTWKLPTNPTMSFLSQ